MDLKINNSAFEIQVLSTLAIKRQGDIKIFQFASAMRRDKKRPKTQQTPLYITSAMARAAIWFINS